MNMPGGWEWFWIFLVALLLFGGKRLPGIARGFTKSLREFRGALDDTKEELRKSEKSEE
jgi:sec-independent protein translocase protein TatA